MKTSNKKGFTLIELLVVIGIIALLASILGPQVAGIFERARVATCSSNQRSIAVGLSLYREDNGNNPPSAPASSNIGKTGYDNPVTDCSSNPTQVDYVADSDNKSEKLKELFKGDNLKCNLTYWFMLVDAKACDFEHFRCPEDEEWKPVEDQDSTLGFGKWINVSYGLQPISPKNWNSRIKRNQQSTMVIIADKPDLEIGDVLEQNCEAQERPNKNHGYKACNVTNIAASSKAKKWTSKTQNDVRFQRKETAMANCFGISMDDIFSFNQTGQSAKKGKKKTAGELTIYDTSAPNDSFCFWSNNDS